MTIKIYDNNKSRLIRNLGILNCTERYYDYQLGQVSNSAYNILKEKELTSKLV